MASSNVTILTSFNQKLPVAPSTYSGNYRSISVSSESTAAEESIPIFYSVSAATIAQVGRSLVFSSGFVPNSSPLKAAMPAMEKTHVLHTEADVTRLAILQLIHPVNVMLAERLPPNARLTCRSETTVSKKPT